MTARSAIRRAALVAAGASSGASEATVLRAVRGFATHSDSTARQPSAPLQQLVHEALTPNTPSSKLLFPTARLASDTRASDASPAQLSRTSASAKAPPTAAAETSSNASEATGSKLYDNRALMIIRLIRLNRILSAMTALMDDVANASRKPFTAAQLESFVVALRIQSKKHSTTRPGPKHSSSLPGHLWRPSQLDPSIPAKGLPIPTQCMYAITTIYDVCIERHIRPTARMTSAMLSSLAGHLDRDQMYTAATHALHNLVPPEARDQASCLRTINHRALASFITIYGRIGKPELGEKLLARWANAQRDGRQPQHQSLMRADEIIDLSGWGNSAVLWQSLIKARVDANDLEGARKWLHRYRTATRSLERDSTSTLSSRPAVTPEPYLAYLAGIRKRAEVSQLTLTQIKSVSADVQAVVRLMTEDRVPIESSVLAFVVDFEAKVGNLSGAAMLFRELDALRESSDLGDVGLIRALFNLHRSAANNPSTTQAASVSSSGLSKSTIEGLPSARLLLRNLVQVGERHVRTSSENLASCRSRGTLNDALITALVEADYPLVVAVLNLFERWRIIPSKTTYTHVVNALISQGHQGALFSDRPGLVQAESKQNVDAVLQSLARQGDGQLARTIRQSLGEETPAGEITVANAKVSSPFRQTQYLIRVLNRVCAAEIENTDPKRMVPGWMMKSRRNTDRPQLLTEKGVWRRVRSYMLEAQDETIGTKDQRKDPELAKPLLSSPKAPLLRTEPFLSPRRSQVKTAPPPPKPVRRTTRRGKSSERALSNGDKQRYMRMSSARSAAAAAAAAAARPSHFRAFSTSALSRNESGASCDLASASKGDFTHLEPVRTIYIPGFVPYSLGLALQEHLVKQRADARAALRALSDTSSPSASTLSGLTTISPSATQTALESQASQDTLLLLQHRPVYTEGRRHDTEDTLVSTALRSLGADYHLTKRGGQITYHGPGQLVGYPILNLSSMNLASRCYVDKIQDSLIALLAQRGIPTVPPPEDHTGVWADEYHKIASIGIQVRHRISSHGFALNVEKRAMAGFRHIVACGIVGRNMTCLHDRLDDNGAFAKYNPAFEGVREKEERVESVAQSYRESFAKVFGRRVRDVREDEFEFELVGESERETLREKLKVAVGGEEMVVRGVKVDGRVVRVE